MIIFSQRGLRLFVMFVFFDSRNVRMYLSSASAPPICLCRPRSCINSVGDVRFKFRPTTATIPLN
jgi:hypothetical protein